MSLKEFRRSLRNLLFIAIGVGFVVNIMASIITSLIPLGLLFVISILTLFLLILWFMYETILKLEPESITYNIFYDIKTGELLDLQYSPCLAMYLFMLNQDGKFRNGLQNLKIKEGKDQVDRDFILYLQEYILLSFLSGYYNLHWDYSIEYNLWAEGIMTFKPRRGKNIPSTQIGFNDIKKIFPKNPLINVFALGALPFNINSPKDTKMIYDCQKRKIILENKYCKITFTPSQILWNRGYQGRSDLVRIRSRINCEVIFNKWRIGRLDRVEENLHWTNTMIKLLKSSLENQFKFSLIF